MIRPLFGLDLLVRCGLKKFQQIFSQKVVCYGTIRKKSAKKTNPNWGNWTVTIHYRHSHRIHGTGIFTYIWLICMVNVGKYTIHGSYGFNGECPYPAGFMVAFGPTRLGGLQELRAWSVSRLSALEGQRPSWFPAEKKTFGLARDAPIRNPWPHFFLLDSPGILINYIHIAYIHSMHHFRIRTLHFWRLDARNFGWLIFLSIGCLLTCFVLRS